MQAEVLINPAVASGKGGTNAALNFATGGAFIAVIACRCFDAPACNGLIPHV